MAPPNERKHLLRRFCGLDLQAEGSPVVGDDRYVLLLGLMRGGFHFGEPSEARDPKLMLAISSSVRVVCLKCQAPRAMVSAALRRWRLFN